MPVIKQKQISLDMCFKQKKVNEKEDIERKKSSGFFSLPQGSPIFCYVKKKNKDTYNLVS